MNKTLIKQLFKLECIKFGSFTLKNGQTSPFYINLRNIISKPEILKTIAKIVYKEHIKKYHLDAIEQGEILSICGLPYAGIPLATYISCLYDIPLLLLRKEEKKYGTKQMIEGITSNTNKVILIDDIITSGSSIRDSLQYFSDLEIIDIVTVIDREHKKIFDNDYKYLYKITEILHFLKLGKIINREEYETSLKFIEKN
jgi:uridine monophosphate synthetase